MRCYCIAAGQPWLQQLTNLLRLLSAVPHMHGDLLLQGCGWFCLSHHELKYQCQPPCWLVIEYFLQVDDVGDGGTAGARLGSPGDCSPASQVVKVDKTPCTLISGMASCSSHTLNLLRLTRALEHAQGALQSLVNLCLLLLPLLLLCKMQEQEAACG